MGGWERGGEDGEGRQGETGTVWRADKGACGRGETSVRAADGGRGERIRTVTGTEEARELARRKERVKLRASEGEETRSSGIRGRRGSRGDTGEKKRRNQRTRGVGEEKRGEVRRRKEREHSGQAERRGTRGAAETRNMGERGSRSTHTGMRRKQNTATGRLSSVSPRIPSPKITKGILVPRGRSIGVCGLAGAAETRYQGVQVKGRDSPEASWIPKQSMRFSFFGSIPAYARPRVSPFPLPRLIWQRREGLVG